MTPTDLKQLAEKVFRKMGWKLQTSLLGSYWEYPNMPTLTVGNAIYEKELPPISSVWEVCAKFLGKFMRERECAYSIGGENSKLGLYFTWYGSSGIMGQAEIKNDNLAEAACLAFLEVKL